MAVLSSAVGQQVGINILYPDSSAILHVESHEKGFLWPRMTTIERNAIPAPAHGLTIFNTEDSTIQYWNSICWLNVYQKDCADCYFNISASAIADTIDRTIADSVVFTLTVDQNAGNPQNIAFTVLGVLPTGMTVGVAPNPLFSSGTAGVTVRVTPFTPAGTYPVIIQTLCGSYFRNVILSVTLTPCYLLNVNNSINNYSASNDLYATYPSAPTASPVCVVVTVDAGVDVTSANATAPAFTTGSLPAGSVVSVINNGNIIGKGGDGGTAYDPVAGTTGAGFNGGDAINLTANSTIQNNFNIYGGGGGGNSMAFALVYTFNIPIIGNFSIGLLVGAGGGGGAGGSLGGNITSSGLVITYYSPGTNGSGGQFGIAGKGGLLLVPFTQSVSVVTITINPNAFGGDGGEYGYPGTLGGFQLTLTITANVPFIGPITIINGLNIPIPVPVPPGGNAGYAVKRNGFTTNIPDNSYNTSFLRGKVGP